MSYGRRRRTGYPGRPRSGAKLRILLAVGMGIFALISYFGSASYNPVTGENQYLSLTPEQEIALGMQAAPEMIQQHGGLHPDAEAQALLDRIGERLVNHSAARDTQWRFDFHLLADPQTVNAFALPGGQVFITAALYSRFTSEGQLAGVLGHEIGHVVARHSAQRIAKSGLTQGLTGAVLVASGESGYGSAQIAQMIGQMINMQYGRDDELQSDELGVLFMAEAGYDPRALVDVMRILEEASGDNRQPEFMSTHPSPDNRVARIREAIDRLFPDGVPEGLIG
ncbi:MAG: M48 family metalloprotease [Gemmatimonadetes bacterium]|nr:M48 family metalloprotease [Gemmatimonadota bacterium]